MSRTLDVHLDGVRAGTLIMTAGGALSFRYEETYRTGADPTPLSQSMPLTSSVHKQRAVLPRLSLLYRDRAGMPAVIDLSQSRGRGGGRT